MIHIQKVLYQFQTLREDLNMKRHTRISLTPFEVLGNVVEGFVVNGNFRTDDKNGEERS